MAAIKQNLRVEQGASFQLVVDVTKAGAPASIAGYTARMQFRKHNTDPEVLDEFTTENGRITVNGTTGQVVVNVPAADTAVYDWSSGEYDLLLTGAGQTYRLLEGHVTVSPSVTR